MSNSSNDTSFSDYTTFSEYRAGILIWKIVPPILILLGTVGNILSILVLTRKSIRSSTTALYLTVLAFSDLLVLYSGLLRQWLKFLFDTDVRHVSQFGCKLNIWLVYSSLDFSAWILIAVTLERVISAWLPHNAKSVCTRKSAAAFLISIGVFILGLNAHLLYGMVFRYKNNDAGVSELKKCIEINDNYSAFFNKTWPWIDLCAFCVIPFAVIVIGNALILFKVLKSQKKTKSRIAPSAVPATTTVQGRGKHSSMTAMLFTLNVVFLICTSPVSIYNIGYPYWDRNASDHQLAQLDLWWAIVNMFMYTNNSLNFLLYCLSGTRFRQEVIRMFSFKKSENGQPRFGQSNYTRTKFDTPSVCPTPRKMPTEPSSARPMTPSSDKSFMYVQVISLKSDTDAVQNISNGQSRFKPSGNSLHPNDALRIERQSTMITAVGNYPQSDEMIIESADSAV